MISSVLRWFGFGLGHMIFSLVMVDSKESKDMVTDVDQEYCDMKMLKLLR